MFGHYPRVFFGSRIGLSHECTQRSLDRTADAQVSPNARRQRARTTPGRADVPPRRNLQGEPGLIADRVGRANLNEPSDPGKCCWHATCTLKYSRLLRMHAFKARCLHYPHGNRVLSVFSLNTAREGKTPTFCLVRKGVERVRSCPTVRDVRCLEGMTFGAFPGSRRLLSESRSEDAPSGT